MPVEISTEGSGDGSMAFVLPKVNSDVPPEPLAGSDVTIEKVPERLVAAKAFGGIVTDQEVERQKALLLEALAADDSVTAVDESKVSVLQYNSPFSVPWRRRNEVAIVVSEKAVDVESPDQATETAATIESESEATSESVAESVADEAAVSEEESEKAAEETAGGEEAAADVATASPSAADEKPAEEVVAKEVAE